MQYTGDKNRMEKLTEKWKSIFKRIVFAFVCVVLLLILPDLLLTFRGWLKLIPHSNIVIHSNILDSNYIKMMTGVLTSCAAICVSVMAYRVVKETGKIQVRQNELQIVLDAKRLRKNIDWNSLLISELKKSVKENGGAQDLVCDDRIEEWIVCLYLSGKISEAQKEYCESYYEKVSRIAKGYAENKEDKVMTEMLNKFCDKYFREDSERMEFCDEMTEVIATLNRIGRGE